MKVLFLPLQNHIKLLLWLTCSTISLLSSAKAEEYIQFTEDKLERVKQALKEGDATPITQKAFKYLLRKADSLLTIKNPTVMDKTLYPPSKNKHDYLSIGRYWWPDPDSKDGLPWIQKDGKTNPSTQNDAVDRNRFGDMASAVRVLSLAYYFTNNEKYAQKGISIINTWFLDENTKMNAHLEYAQSVPGNNKGRRSGILDGRIIPERILDAVTMLSASSLWTKKHSDSMNSWLNEYFTWLTTSDLGKAGAKQKNNHGSWYRFQIASLAWHLGDSERFSQVMNEVKQSVGEQFDKNGAQAHELRRTRGYFYSCFNLKALTLIGKLAEKNKMNLWQYQAEGGQNLKQAVNYLIPAVKGEVWPHTSQDLDVSFLVPALSALAADDDKSEYRLLLSMMLKKLAKQKEFTTNERKTLFEFALFEPQYF